MRLGPDSKKVKTFSGLNELFQQSDSGIINITIIRVEHLVLRLDRSSEGLDAARKNRILAGKPEINLLSHVVFTNIPHFPAEQFLPNDANVLCIIQYTRDAGIYCCYWAWYSWYDHFKDLYIAIVCSIY